jgi:hypothetical protein
MVGGSLALAFEGLSFALMVDCLGIFLELVLSFTFMLSLVSIQDYGARN